MSFAAALTLSFSVAWAAAVIFPSSLRVTELHKDTNKYFQSIE
jgi:hypothetical protein